MYWARFVLPGSAAFEEEPVLQCYDVTAWAIFIACDRSAISEPANRQNCTARVKLKGKSHIHSQNGVQRNMAQVL